ncbi:MAG: thioredoxin [Bacteroidia bacterium]|nr:MAG: thioredoxin [Bacteroidia bacterium]
MPNHLINETSPYLLQHAHQPVNWHPYSQDIFDTAKKENKPIIISIGYSTCHWCHVMAHECFEDNEVAELMNKHFICVKVDREELPDIDRYYMNAIQILTGHGGWPLNAFALPDGKPFYAVTYMPINRWKELLIKIHELYQNNFETLKEYADNIHNGIQTFELAELSDDLPKKDIHIQDIQQKIPEWKKIFDTEYGGHLRTPKFVMPINYRFFIQYNILNFDTDIDKHLYTSLMNIMLGGLFDHVAGGFYRYSTDRYWKIPHFEKMLYDNAQMTELLCNYYLYLKNNINSPESKENKISAMHITQWIIQKNIQYIIEEFQSDDHLFYSAYDADSEGKEGKYYVWTIHELQQIVQNDYKEFSEIFNIQNNFGYWENDHYVLTINIPLFLKNPEYYISKIDQWTILLLQYRNQRIKPAVDTKIITAWNALMIKALALAAISLKNEKYLQQAEKSLQSLLSKVYIDEHLYHIYHHSQSKIPAYLDDYAFLIDAVIQLAKITGNTHYLKTAENIAHQCINDFYSPSKSIFYYTSARHSINNSINLYDDVIPSANAQMINNLIYLYHLTNNPAYKKIAEASARQTHSLFFNNPQYAASYGNIFLSQYFYDTLEISVVGQNATEYLKKIFPQVFFVNEIYTQKTHDHSNTYAIFENRFHPAKTFIYVCQHSACHEPIENPDSFNIRQYL